MSTYDGIILAAGRNTRLAGMVPSYYKPLLIVQGKPLIVRLVSDMKPFTGRVTVVVSPENANPICEILAANDLLDARVNVVIQPVARGPGEGLYRGLQCARHERIIMACGDNFIPADDFQAVYNQDNGASPQTVTASTSFVTDEAEAYRFTRVADSVISTEFIEGRPGGQVTRKDGRVGWNVWVGPLVFDRENALLLFQEEVLRYKSGDPEIKISQVFNQLLPLKIRAVSGHSLDIGTADALLEKANG